MNHLTVDELTEFVSFEKADGQDLALAARVNAHIGQCESCLRKVRAFQTVFDEMRKTALFAGEAERKAAVLTEEKTLAAAALTTHSDI